MTYDATARDNADPAPTVTCSRPSGSVFPIGTTTVNCTATDRAGNTAGGTFSVTVKGAKEQLNDLIQKVAWPTRPFPARRRRS